MKEYFDKMLIESLKEKGIDIYAPDYKESENYFKEKLALISTPDGIVTTEEYIEYYLLSANLSAETYKSKYDMGNPCKLNQADCSYIALTKEIMRVNEAIDEDIKDEDKERDAKDESIVFTRPNGYIDQLKKHLDLNLETFESTNLTYQGEKFKILYWG